MLLYGLRSYGKVSKKKSPDMDLDMSYLHIAIIKGQGCTLSLEKCLSEKDYNRLGDKSRRNPRSDIKKEKLVRGTGFEPANARATGPSTLLL